MHTAESIFSNCVITYIGEIETEFENTSACLSGAKWVRIMEKTGGRKSRDALPLRRLILSERAQSKRAIEQIPNHVFSLCLLRSMK